MTMVFYPRYCFADLAPLRFLFLYYSAPAASQRCNPISRPQQRRLDLVTFVLANQRLDQLQREIHGRPRPA